MPSYTTSRRKTAVGGLTEAQVDQVKEALSALELPYASITGYKCGDFGHVEIGSEDPRILPTLHAILPGLTGHDMRQTSVQTRAEPAQHARGTIVSAPAQAPVQAAAPGKAHRATKAVPFGAPAPAMLEYQGQRLVLLREGKPFTMSSEDACVYGLSPEGGQRVRLAYYG